MSRFLLAPFAPAVCVLCVAALPVAAAAADPATYPTDAEYRAMLGISAPTDAPVAAEVTAPSSVATTAPTASAAASPTIVERYRRGNPYANQLALSPSAILLPSDSTRLGLTEIVFQQINFGLSDSVQIGVNSTFLFTVGGDVKIRLTDLSSDDQISVLVGGGIATFDYRNVAIYVRPAYSHLFEYDDGRIGLFNLSGTFGTGGTWIGEQYSNYEYPASPCYDPPCPQPVERIHRDKPTLFQSGQLIAAATAGLDLPWRDSSWGWVIEGGVGLMEFDNPQPALVGAGFAGARYRKPTWGMQFGLIRPIAEAFNNDYILAFPVLDLSWVW